MSEYPRTVVMSRTHKVGCTILRLALEAAGRGDYALAAQYARQVDLPGLDTGRFVDFLDAHGDFPRFP